MSVRITRGMLEECIQILKLNFLETFILVGGASMMKLGSARTTSDVDVLIPSTANLQGLITKLRAQQNFNLQEGTLYIQLCNLKIGHQSIKLDILTQLINEKTFEDLKDHIVVEDGVKLLNLGNALGVKLKAWYTRADDENGECKRDSDLHDVCFLAQRLHRMGLHSNHAASVVVPPFGATDSMIAGTIRNIRPAKETDTADGQEGKPKPMQVDYSQAFCDKAQADLRPVGHGRRPPTAGRRDRCSHCIRLDMEERHEGSLEVFIAVGAYKFLKSWEESSSDEQEFYEVLAEAGSDPLTMEFKD